MISHVRAGPPSAAFEVTVETTMNLGSSGGIPHRKRRLGLGGAVPVLLAEQHLAGE